MIVKPFIIVLKCPRETQLVPTKAKIIQDGFVAFKNTNFYAKQMSSLFEIASISKD